MKITGYWGWPATPAQIIEACYLQCERLYQRRNSPMGGGRAERVRAIDGVGAARPGCHHAVLTVYAPEYEGCMIVRIVGLEQAIQHMDPAHVEQPLRRFFTQAVIYIQGRTDQRSGVSRTTAQRHCLRGAAQGGQCGECYAALSQRPSGRRRSGWSTARARYQMRQQGHA